jgi:hypothetical protein
LEAAVVTPVGAAVAGLAGAATEFWQNAFPVANSVATAAKVIILIISK